MYASPSPFRGSPSRPNAGMYAQVGVETGVTAADPHKLVALLFDGLLSLALGVMIVWGWPGTAVWALGLLVGLDLIFGGASTLAIGLSAGSPRETHTAGAHP